MRQIINFNAKWAFSKQATEIPAALPADWEIVETKKGKALSCWYDENRRNNITQIPSFDPTSWVEE